jgi:predicted nuclease of predicted toxin-antitoxin system
VRPLIDQNLAAQVASLLRDAGHDVVHVSERGLQRADDEQIVELAATESRVVISEDTDFGALLGRSGATLPSFVPLRTANALTPDEQAALIAANLPAIANELETGCIAVLSPLRIRVRPLPITPAD